MPNAYELELDLQLGALMDVAIIWPTLALVALVYMVWFVMYRRRFAHMKRTPPTPADFADGEAALRYFRPVEMPANNLANLFEMPVLYFALVPLLLHYELANVVQVALAWGFVAARAAHSWVHVTRGPVLLRFWVYVAGCAIVAAMWIGFAVDLSKA